MARLTPNERLEPDGQPSMDRRRFAGVALGCDGTSTEEVLRQLDLTVSNRSGKRQSETWDLGSYTFFSKRLFFPRTSFSAGGSPEPRAGFDHPIYVAKSTAEPLLILLAPYVGLLDRMLLKPELPDSRLSFLAPDLPALYQDLASPDPLGLSRRLSSLRATKIGIQHNGDKDVELVSLTGRNPLRSDLWRSISRTYAPYSLRVHPVVEERRAGPSVNLDRHGNLWMFATDDQALLAGVQVVQVLYEAERLIPVSWNPLDRRSTTE